jgi:hypothetical protein
MSFVHAAAPRPVLDGGRTGIKVLESTGSQLSQPMKQRYRDPLLQQQEQDTIYVQPNIMFDPRVQRGPTAGKTAVLASTLKQEQLASTLQRSSQAASTNASSAGSSPPPSRSKQQLLSTGAIRPAQPSVAYIHNHITVVKKRREVPMHLYLIEQKEETLVHHIDQQTDAMMPEAPTPDYIPRKTGVDTATQVDNAMVFVFDEDVQAILEVVVSKNLEQALMEVREEEELAAIERHRVELEEKYNAEEAAAEDRLKEERILFAAKEKLLAQARTRQQHIDAIRSKLAAGHFSRRYLSGLTTHVMADLTQAGLFLLQDSLAHQIEAAYVPGVARAVDLELAKTSGARALVTEMITSSLTTAISEKKALEAQRAEEERIRKAKEKADREAAEELARRRAKIQLFIHSSAVPSSASPVGPINLTGESKVDEIERKVWRWMEEVLGEEMGLDVPARERLRFLWNGAELSTSSDQAVYDLGISNLATLTMELLPLPEPPKADGAAGKRRKKKKAKRVNSDGEEEEDGEDDDEDGEDDEEEEESGADGEEAAEEEKEDADEEEQAGDADDV